MRAAPAASGQGEYRMRRLLAARPDQKGEIMTISKERKAELTAQFGKNAADTGNPKVRSPS